MLARLILVVALIAVCSAQTENTIAYAGTTEGAPTFSPATISSGTCAAAGFTAPYIAFGAMFGSNGVREVAALAEKDFKSVIAIYVYSNFAPNSPCSNLIGNYLGQELYSSDGGPVVDDFFYFQANMNYTYVVTHKSSGYAGGIFAVNIYPSNFYGSTSPGANLWSGVEDSGSTTNYACDTADEDSYYTTYTWTQQTSGYYDIRASMYNSSLIGQLEVQMALYHGSNTGLINSTDSCISNFINASSTDYASATLYYVWLQQGNTYTVVTSGYEAMMTGYMAVRVYPTLIRFPVYSGWTQPNRDTTTCSSSSNTDAAYGIVTFQATNQVYLFDTQAPPSQFSAFDTYSFMYYGNNSNGILSSVPSTCPLKGALVNSGDTGDVTPVFTVCKVGSVYTVIVSTYSGGSLSSANSAYILYYFTGTSIGNVPGASTTSAAVALAPSVAAVVLAVVSILSLFA